MSDSAESRISREKESKLIRLSLIAQIAVTLLVVYVLSIGPALRLARSSKEQARSRVILNVIYYPLQWLYDNVPETQKPLRWYLDLWGKESEDF